MPIGKNAIKRVSSGASTQPTEAAAPAAEPKVEETTKAAPAPEKKPTAKKSTAPKAAAPKAAPQKSMEKEPELSPVATAKKVTKKAPKAQQEQGFCHICIGQDLPIYLL